MEPPFIDTHCHLHMDNFKKDRQEVMDRARREGLALMITVGIDRKDSEAALYLAQREPHIYCTVGFHPHGAGRVTPEDLAFMKKMAHHEKVVALGEMGLDYYRDLSPRRTQQEIFISQLELAKELGKPIVIHCRDAYRDLIRIMMDHSAKDIGGVIHCFSGDWNAARIFLDMGFYLSFAGNLTYPKAENLREIFQKAPKDRLLMETDAPFLSPQEKRGKRNEPAFVKFTYKLGAELKGLTLIEWARQVASNAQRAFPSLDNLFYIEQVS